MKNSAKTLLVSSALVAVSLAPAAAQNIECGVLLDQASSSPLLESMSAEQRSQYDGLLNEASALSGSDERACVLKAREADTFAFEQTGQRVFDQATLASFETTESDNMQVAQADTGAATATGTATGVMGGNIVVSQPEPQVEVFVPEPDISIDQAAPEVIVTQGEPEITVTVPKPNVNVEQQAPIITVTQAQPTVTVRIPEPTVRIRVPQPEVDVSQGDAQVAVNTPQPIVRFERPEPQIRIEQSEAQVEIEQADANVDIQETDQARLAVRQADPVVNIEQAEGEANIQVEQAEAQVQIEEAADPNIQVEQAEAEVQVEQVEADAVETAQATDTQVSTDAASVQNAYISAVETTPFIDMDVAQLTNVDVYSENGENIGSINGLVRDANNVYALLEVGGFLGIGDAEVVAPLSQMAINGDNVVLPLTEDQAEALPEYDEGLFQPIEGEGSLRDALAQF